jgi:3-oxoacyl-[acyl-carrier protein] reductase
MSTPSIVSPHDAAAPARRGVALITGSATGIGAECARTFARHGWDVGITYLNDDQRADAEAIASDCAALGAQSLLVALDVTEDASCIAAVHAMRERFAHLDALVNCAGTTRFIPHADLDALPTAEFARTYDVNLVGTFRMIRACSEALRDSGRGAVVNISSIAGTAGLGSSVAYAASKGAVNTLTLSLARALAPHIRVNAIAPAYVAGGLPSRVLEGEKLAAVEAHYLKTQALPRLLQTPEVAALAFFLAASAPGMTGEIIRMDNGLHLYA